MERTATRMLMAAGLGLASMILFWAGYQILLSGGAGAGFEARFEVERLLGSHLLWMFSGAAAAVVLTIGSPAIAERPSGPPLAAAIVPILIMLPIYIWGNPLAPIWLPLIPSEYLWLFNPTPHAAAAVLTGALLGTALLRRVASPGKTP